MESERKNEKDIEYITDRNGNKICISIIHGSNEYKLTRKIYEHIYGLFKSSIKKELYKYLVYIDLDVIKCLVSGNLHEAGEHIRLNIFKKLLNIHNTDDLVMKVEIENKKIFMKSTKSVNSLFLICKELIMENQYDINKENIEGKIVIDAGANVGIFSLYASALGAEKVYAFEPVPETYTLLVENIKLNKLEDKIIAINKALGNEEKVEQIYYNLAGDGAAQIETPDVNSKIRYIKSARITMIPLDKFIKENKISRVDFIKMDVEGYEENVLLGAKETIKNWKPILSFSAYHKKTDKIRLPEVVKSIRPDYKIKLNTFGDEDFYCG